MDTFASKIQETASRLDDWLQLAADDGDEADDLCARQILSELQTAMEQLRVAEEEMRSQNEALEEARVLVEEERQRYQELFESAPDAYLVTSPAGAIREANRAAADLLGVPQQFLARKPLATYVPVEDRPRLRARIAQLADGADGAAGERPREWEARLLPRGAASPLPVALTVAVVRGPDGSATGLRWIVRDITERRALEAERERRAEDHARREAADRQRRFVREMLYSVTAGRLRLCDSASDLPPRLPPAGEPVALSAATVRRLRRLIAEAAGALRMPRERVDDMATAATEAATNAVKHAGGGDAEVGADAAAGVLQVLVRDHGGGIREESLHRATLEKGWTTAGTLGHGFWLMLKTCDRIWLLTGPEGTTVVLEQERTPPSPAWL